MATIADITKFSFSKKNAAGQRKFMNYASAIFQYDVTLSYKSTLHDIVQKLRSAYRSSFNNNSFPEPTARRSFLLLNFLGYLGIIDKKKGEKMENQDRIEGFLAEYEDFFGGPEKKVAFLTGILIQKLVNWGPEPKPFLKKLGDFSFDRMRLLKLRSQIEHKLTQYDRDYNALFFTRDLRQKLDLAWAETSPKWDIPEDELTLAVIMGMNLNWHLTGKHKDDKGEEE